MCSQTQLFSARSDVQARRFTFVHKSFESSQKLNAVKTSYDLKTCRKHKILYVTHSLVRILTLHSTSFSMTSKDLI